MRDHSLSPTKKLILRLLAAKSTDPMRLEDLVKHGIRFLNTPKDDIDKVRAALTEDTRALGVEKLLKLAEAHPHTEAAGAWVSITEAGLAWIKANT